MTIFSYDHKINSIWCTHLSSILVVLEKYQDRVFLYRLQIMQNKTEKFKISTIESQLFITQPRETLLVQTRNNIVKFFYTIHVCWHVLVILAVDVTIHLCSQQEQSFSVHARINHHFPLHKFYFSFKKKYKFQFIWLKMRVMTVVQYIRHVHNSNLLVNSYPSWNTHYRCCSKKKPN